MDAYEATKTVFSRIQSLDPENASKIMGLLLIQDHGDKEMIRLAFGPEALLHSVIYKARAELGLSSNTLPAPLSPSSPSPTPFLSRQSSSSSRLLGSAVSAPPPLAIPNPPLATSWDSSAFSDYQNPDDLISPSSSSAASYRPQSRNNGISKALAAGSISSSPISSSSGFCAASDLMEEFQFQDQLYPPYCGGGDSMLFPSYGGDGAGSWGGLPHRRSCSVNDICFGGGGAEDLTAGFGWRPCHYFSRGYCKNGTTCRFLHGGGEAEAGSGKVVSPGSGLEHCELLRSKSAHHQRLAAASQLMGSSFPYSPSKCMSFLQQNDAQRAMMMGEDMHKFGRGRPESSPGMVTPSSRQIYLTFPADSTFREEDVSNYFSIYGPVEDVRIPYQQKRMFGFVTFVYPETVKIILAKGNPHFVCDARVLVKPYKEKGKVPDKYRKQQSERMDFSSACSTPTGLDSRVPLELQFGPRGLYNSQNVLWRRRLEEQADLQEAIELQSRRLMGLQLLDVKKPFHSPNFSAAVAPPVKSPIDNPPNTFSAKSSLPSDTVKGVQDNGSGAANVGTETDSLGSDQNGDAKESSLPEDSNFKESFEHNLPDSPFASPKKVMGEHATSAFSEANGEADCDPSIASSSTISANCDPSIASSLLLASSTLDMASFKSCYFPLPRFPPSQETVGM